MRTRLPLLLGAALCSCTSAAPPALFAPLPLDFEVVWDDRVHPFTGAAAIDIDGDGVDEVFIGGGLNQVDRLYRYQDGALRNIIAGTGLDDTASAKDATHGVLSVDLEGDGDVDLAIARAGGVYLYLNDGEGRFSERHVSVPSAPPEAEPLHVAVTDYDRDGDADLYVSYFVAYPSFRSAVFNDPGHAKTNRLLRNDGDLTFTDVTEHAGVGGSANTFTAMFVDLNQDTYDDLVLAQNTWQVELHANQGDGTFERRGADTGYGFWMGVGVGDIDRDGDQDLFFPNVGKSIPRAFTRGDIRNDQRHTHDWALLRNDGNFEFANVTEDWGIKGEGFAWGGVFEDVNLDGHLDLFVAQNYLKWPLHALLKLKGKAYLQTVSEKGAPTFRNAPELGLVNKRYGQSSLFADVNGDGRLDYFWINMGDRQAAWLNVGTGDFVAFRLPDDLRHLGTRIHLETATGNSYTRVFLAGQGFLTDQSSDLVFGLGSETRVERVVVTWPDGSRKIIENPAINRRHLLAR